MVGTLISSSLNQLLRNLKLAAILTCLPTVEHIFTGWVYGDVDVFGIETLFCLHERYWVR